MRIAIVAAVCLVGTVAHAQTVTDCYDFLGRLRCESTTPRAPQAFNPLDGVARGQEFMNDVARDIEARKAAQAAISQNINRPPAPTNQNQSALDNAAARQVGQLIRAGHCSEAIGVAEGTGILGMVILTHAACEGR